MSCGTMPCVCGSWDVELGEAATVCSVGEPKFAEGIFSFCPTGKSSLLLSRHVYAPSYRSASYTFVFGTAPNMHGQLGTVLVGGATFQWLKSFS